MTVKSLQTPLFYVHSTFRGPSDELIRPVGLQWDLPGVSHITYVPHNQAEGIEDSAEVRRGILEAHNLWCFAKDLPFRHTEDIDTLIIGEDGHIHVEWKTTPRKYPRVAKHENIKKLIRVDEANEEGKPPVEVWANGSFVGVLDGTKSSLDKVLHEISVMDSDRVCLKRSDGLIQVERYFSSYLRNRRQVFDHVLDNLIALEDPEMLNENTLIGTATLPDWIMGGQLTSRLWIQELDSGNILFLRPLRDDNVNTSDRRFELEKGREDAKIAMVKVHLERLRYLASLKHPFVPDNSKVKEKENRMNAIREKSRMDRRRRVFGL